MKTWSLGSLFGPRVDFWWILGPRRGPKNDPKSDPDIENYDLIGPGGPQGAPRANFGRFLVHFGVILGPQMAILGPSWDAFGSNQQQTAAKISK